MLADSQDMVLVVVDRLSPEARSQNMSRIRGRDTHPELAIRKALHRRGYRYRLHAPNLPGRPDLVFSSRRKVIFVHGCFWHQHPGCPNATQPKTRSEFWGPKLRRNVERDKEQRDELKKLGWSSMTVWECEITDPSVINRIESFLK